jgi:hypothetical protein
MRKGITHSSFSLTATVLAILMATTLLFASGHTRAADAGRGRLLYENHCMVCHTSVVHVRERRKAASREEIQTWIQHWRKELGLQWGTAEVDDVTKYLNDRYYHLKTEGIGISNTLFHNLAMNPPYAEEASAKKFLPPR